MWSLVRLLPFAPLFIDGARASIAEGAKEAGGDSTVRPIISSAGRFSLGNDQPTKRADATVTITLGPPASYTTTITSTPVIPATAGFTIVPAGDAASDGMNIVLAPSAKASIEKAVQDKCKSQPPTSQEIDSCVSAIQDILPAKEVALQKREYALLVGSAGIAAIIAFLFSGTTREDSTGTRPSNTVHDGHLSGQDIDQLKSPDSISAIKIVPHEGAPPIVLPLKQNDGPSGPVPTIERTSNGGVKMTTNTDLGQKTKARLDAWQNSDPKCHNVRTKRDFRSVVLHERQDPVNFAVAVGCIITGAQVFLNEVNRGALAPWTRIRQAGQGPIAPEAAGAGVVIQQIRQRAEPLRRQMGLDIEGMTRLIISALWNLFEQIYGQWLMDDTGSITVSPEDVKADYCSRLEGLKCSDELCKGTNNKCDPNTPFKGCKCDDDEPQDCPSKEPLHCVNCGGVGEKDRCQGISDEDFLFKGCECIADGPTVPAWWGDAKAFARMQDAILKLPKIGQKPPGPLPPPSCDLSGKAITYETAWFQQLAKHACDPALKPNQMDVLAASWDVKIWHDNYKEWFVDWKWEDKPGDCADKCEKIFSSFLLNKQCTPSVHSMAPSGKIEQDCGTASYQFVWNKDFCPVDYPDVPSGTSATARSKRFHEWWDANLCEQHCPPNTGVDNVPARGIGKCKGDPCAGMKCGIKAQGNPFYDGSP